jgi:hypothetical protein
MAAETELTGLGVAPQLANLLGGQPNVLTCAGTTQGAGAKIKSKNTELSTGASAYVAVLPSGALYAPYFVFTSSSTSAVVYPPTGQYLNGSQNGSLTVAQNKAATFWQYKKGYWASILTA